MGVLDCTPGKVHRFDKTSGWCDHGCGVRSDQHVSTRRGDIIRAGHDYTPAELAELRRRIDPGGED